MTQLTAASDLYDRGSSEYHELSESLKTLVESAYYLRTAWEMLDTLTYTSRREGRHDDSHDLRSPEQSAYLAWQAAELAYQQIIGRLVATMDPATGEIAISEPAAAAYDIPAMLDRFDAAWEATPVGGSVGVCLHCGYVFADGQDHCPTCEAPQTAFTEPAPAQDVYCQGCGWQGMTAFPHENCPQCGLPDLRVFAQGAAERAAIAWEDHTADAQAEAERKQRANAASVADGHGPTYASEY